MQLSDEQKIRDLVKTWLAASKDADVAAMLNLMSDDVIFMVPGREPFGKKEFASTVTNMKKTEFEGTSDIQEIDIHGDWAWMRNHLDMTMTTPDGVSQHRSGYVLTILRKNPSGEWVISRDANLILPFGK